MKGLQHMLDEDGERSMPVPQASGPILLLVKEFAAYRSTHTFPDIDKPLDNRGKLERSLPNDAGSTANWWRDFIDRQPMVGRCCERSSGPASCFLHFFALPEPGARYRTTASSPRSLRCTAGHCV